MWAESATKCSFPLELRQTSCRRPAHRITTHLAVREDAHVLYGFMTPAERDLFRLLVNNVSGIGPKLALAVLSGMSVTSFKAAVVNSDVAAISKISGLGKKTAERIVRELKDKLGVVLGNAGAPRSESDLAYAQAYRGRAAIASSYKPKSRTKQSATSGKRRSQSAEDLVKLARKWPRACEAWLNTLAQLSPAQRQFREAI